MKRFFTRLLSVAVSIIFFGVHTSILASQTPDPCCNCCEENEMEFLPFGFETGGTNSTSLPAAKIALEIPELPLSIENGGTNSTSLPAAKTVLGIPELPLSLANGGLGATTAANARINLGISFTSGSWTPSLQNESGTNPTFSGTPSAQGRWQLLEIGGVRLMYIAFDIVANITNVGNTASFAVIRNLPRANAGIYTSLAVGCSESLASGTPNVMTIYGSGGTFISIRDSKGNPASKWKTGTVNLSGSGLYVCSA